MIEGTWRSEGIAELATALAVAQSKIKNAPKDAKNPFFNTRYADLAGVWDACREALTANGLSVTQHPTMSFQGEPQLVVTAKERGGERVSVRCVMQVTLHTRLLHKSGEWMESTLTALLPSADPQTVGSSLTYLRRYGLAAMVGVAAEDDDGNTASGRHHDEHDQREERPRNPQPTRPPQTPAKPVAAKAEGKAPLPPVQIPEGASAAQIVVGDEVAKQGERGGKPFTFRRLTTADNVATFYFEEEWKDLPAVVAKFIADKTPVEIVATSKATPNGPVRMLTEITPTATGVVQEPVTTDITNELPPATEPSGPDPDDDIPF
jgi:hypothetical protein